MIVAERKPLKEILANLEPFKKVLVLGCGECVTVCMAGGDKEARETALALSIARNKAGNPIEVKTHTVERQCEPEYLESVRHLVEEADVVVSLACGVGIQNMNMYFDDKRTLPGVNTTFMGMPTAQGEWMENCLGCGNCVLDETMGICPIARCSKSMLNGPCGGSQNGKCEVNKDLDCAWHLIVERLMKFNKLDALQEIKEPKDWSTSHNGGPRKMIREDVKL
ncbi:MAG TPA: methylenetetrahydrofolate reductase C-terminal domain-containing protein [Oscillospiraceae bacterium]|nr:methylenetetrahydrofolate reductase C-terminal domain-containing protein [Oscillospiraceae bacterium]